MSYSVSEEANIILVKVDDGVYRVHKNRHHLYPKFINSNEVVNFLNDYAKVVIFDKNNEVITSNI